MPLLETLATPAGRLATLVLAHFLWQGLAVAGMLAVTVSLLRIERPQARYAASLATLVAMLLCPAATLVWLLVDLPPTTSAAESSGSSPAAGVLPLASVEGPPIAHKLQQLSAFQPYALAAWLVGVSLFASRLLLGVVGTARLRRERLALPLELASRVERLGRRMQIDALPLVFLSRQVTEALAVGLVRPLVLVPAAWATEMPPAMLQAVIAHELAHLRRRDLWINLVQRIAETVLFYHPAVWWLSRRLRIERELCADELAVAATGQRLVYAEALEQVAHRRRAEVRPLLAAFMRGGKNMRLLERVRNVLGTSPGERSRLWPAGIVALALPLGLWLVSLGLPAAVAEDVAEGPVPMDFGFRVNGLDGLEGADERIFSFYVGFDEDRREEVREEERGDRPRDVERPPRRGPRDGEAPDVRERGPRDGEFRGPPRPGPRDGELPPRFRGGGAEFRLPPPAMREREARIEELTAMVRRLSEQVERLQAELNEVRGQRGEERGPREFDRRRIETQERPADLTPLVEAAQRDAVELHELRSLEVHATRTKDAQIRQAQETIKQAQAQVHEAIKRAHEAERQAAELQQAARRAVLQEAAQKGLTGELLEQATRAKAEAQRQALEAERRFEEAAERKRQSAERARDEARARAEKKTAAGEAAAEKVKTTAEKEEPAKKKEPAAEKDGAPEKKDASVTKPDGAAERKTPLSPSELKDFNAQRKLEREALVRRLRDAEKKALEEERKDQPNPNEENEESRPE